VTSFADRLRGVVRPRAGTEGPSPDAPHSGPNGPLLRTDGDAQCEDVRSRGPLSPRCDDAADALGGEWREVGGHRYLIVDRRYPPNHRHGRVHVYDAALPDGTLPRLHLLRSEATRMPRHQQCVAPQETLLFIDLETTGLAGGAGTYAFLVGCAWFEPPSSASRADLVRPAETGFRTRQFFLSSFAAERVLLEAVAALASQAHTVVTYNGKAFDLPLIETRFLLHRLTTPFAALPHVDMLHPARRLWRLDEQDATGESSCKLTVLERTLCGYEREGDVPGFEIPARYFNYVRNGDARPLEAVLEHNRLDLLSLAFFTARAAQLLDAGPARATTAREALGMARLYERGGLTRDADSCYRRAAELPGDSATRAEALRGSALLARRERRYADAAEAWSRLLVLRHCAPHLVREATEALAVHHEHRLRNLEAARRFAVQSLQLQGTASRKQATLHRLARLDRKMGLSNAAGLF
jgi:uncharacterized protein